MPDGKPIPVDLARVPLAIVRELLEYGREYHSGKCRYCDCELFDDGITEDSHHVGCPLAALRDAVKLGAVEDKPKWWRERDGGLGAFAASLQRLPLVELPQEPQVVEFTREVRIAADDLNRFIDAGGVIKTSGFTVYVDHPKRSD